VPSLLDPHFASAATRGLATWSAQVRRQNDKVVLGGALVLERTIKELLSQPGTGRTWYIRRAGGFSMRHTYARFGGKWGFMTSVGRQYNKRTATGARYWAPTPPGKPHVASKPGQPPAVDEGTLRASVGHEVMRPRVRVGTGMKKAVGLEWGTSIVRPRPFMRPALRLAKAAMTDQVCAELRTQRGRLA
jgi:hypothetical protein